MVNGLFSLFRGCFAMVKNSPPNPVDSMATLA